MINSMVPFTRLNDIVDSLFGPNYTNYWSGEEACGVANANVAESDKEYVVRMDLPGVRREDLQIDLEDDTLKITARRESAIEEGFKTLRTEIPAKMVYRRSFTIGHGVDRDGIKANLADGMLTINLPKTDVVMPRRIEVQ